MSIVDDLYYAYVHAFTSYAAYLWLMLSVYDYVMISLVKDLL